MDIFKKFLTRFLLVILFFLAFELVNIKPFANSNSTGTMIIDNISVMTKNTGKKDVILNFIRERDLNGIFRMLAHMTIFGCLSLIIMWALSVYDFTEFNKILYAVVITSIFGLLDEIVQLFIPNRQFRYIDVLKDDIGALIFSSFLYHPVYNFLKKYRDILQTPTHVFLHKFKIYFLKNGLSKT